jgi:phosphopantetheine adenylyltransferase
MWPASWVRIAKLFKEVEGRFDPNIMSANVDLVRTALQRQSKVSVELIRNKSKPVQEFKSMFSLEARLQGIK